MERRRIADGDDKIMAGKIMGNHASMILPANDFVVRLPSMIRLSLKATWNKLRSVRDMTLTNREATLAFRR